MKLKCSRCVTEKKPRTQSKGHGHVASMAKVSSHSVTFIHSSYNFVCTYPLSIWDGGVWVTQPHLVLDFDLLSASCRVITPSVFLPIKDESSNFWHVASKHGLHAWNRKRKVHAKRGSAVTKATEAPGILTFCHLPHYRNHHISCGFLLTLWFQGRSWQTWPKEKIGDRSRG